MRKHRDIKLVTIERRRNYLVSGLNYHTTNFFTQHLLALERKKKTKACVIKTKFKFEYYKNCLEVTQLQNKMNYLEKNKIEKESIKKNQKEFIKNNKSILKIQQKFKSEKHSVFTGEIEKIALSSNDNKRMQSIDLIETYAYETSKNVVSDEEEIK